MKECSDCGKKAIWKCTDCDIYLCTLDRRNHYNIYPSHTFKKSKKSMPGKRPKLFASKLSLINQYLQENTNSTKSLRSQFTEARESALDTIHQKQKSYLNLLKSLNEELTEDQYKEVELKLQELNFSILLYENYVPSEVTLWHQYQSLEEVARFPFNLTADQEDFKINEYTVSVVNPSIPVLPIDVNCFKIPSKFREIEVMERASIEREALKRENNLTIANKLHYITIEIERTLLELKSQLEKDIHKASNQLSTNAVDNILNSSEKYSSPCNSLESEFNRFYKLTLANIEVVEKSNIKLLTWINEAITEDITDETSKLEEKIIPALQEGIESCKNFLVYCNENILSFAVLLFM